MINRSALAAAMILAGLAGPAFAADDGYENVFTSVLGAVGVLPTDDTPEIDYRERAPLVVPPRQTLVTPQQPGAARTAAWPVDPDLARREKNARDARAPRVEHQRDQMLSKDEQLKYRAAQEPKDPYSADECTIRTKGICRITPEDEERAKRMNPDKGSTTLAAGVEPERTYLTQPPKGYLKSTKNVAVTHEAPRPKIDDSSPLSTYIQPQSDKADPLSQ